MELRQLALFVMACQCRSLTETARQAGVSVSTLSKALAALERRLGLALFRRLPGGLAPTEAGRWLFQESEGLLRLAEAVATDRPPDFELRVHSPLRFMFGRLSRASAAAARDLGRDHPETFVSVRFASPYAAGLGLRGHPDADIVMSYSTAAETAETFLFDDEWVAVGRAGDDGGFGPGPPFADLWIPPLPTAEEARIRAHCRENGWPAPERVAEDAGILSRLARARHPTRLLAPRSLVSAGMARTGLACTPLDPPCRSPVTARIAVKQGPLAGAAIDFVGRLVMSIEAPAPFSVQDYDPPFSLRDARAITALAEGPSMTEAARRLGLSQPALSARLAEFEHRLGVPLFRRHSAGLELLPEGRRRAPWMQRIAERAETIRQQARIVAMQDMQEVTLLHGAALFLCPEATEAFADAVHDWRAEWPGAVLRLVEASAPRIEAALRTGETGLAIFEATAPRRSTRTLLSLGPLVAVGADDASATAGGLLALPSEKEGVGRAIAAIRPEAALSGASLQACLALARAGCATILPQRIADTLPATAARRPVSPATIMMLNTGVTTERPLGEAEQFLLACLRRRFAACQEASAR